MRAKRHRRDAEYQPKTVDTYRANLMRKLNVRDIVETGQVRHPSATLPST